MARSYGTKIKVTVVFVFIVVKPDVCSLYKLFETETNFNKEYLNSIDWHNHGPQF